MGVNKEPTSSSHEIQVPETDDTTTTPLLLKQPKHLSSSPKTFANIFIAIVGAGVLGLPYTFKQTGWIMGSLMIFVVAFLTYHCMMLLVYTRRKLESLNDGEDSKIASFGDLGFVVCGSIGRFCVDIMIVLAQAGFCVSYLIFIGNTLANIFNHGSYNSKVNSIDFLSPKSLYIWGCFPFQLGLNSIPTLTSLAPLSIFADVVDLGAMGVVIVEDVIVFLKNRVPVKGFGGFSVFFYGLGVAVYAFEGIGMIVPLELETREKEKFGKVLGWCMGSIALIYGSFGVLGYLAFGEETKDIITINLGEGILSDVIQIGLAINLFFTMPPMMNPVYEVVERRFCQLGYCLWLRWLMVLGVTLVALMVPNFADFLSLVGSSVCCILGFVLPSLFHFMVFKHELGWFQVLCDALIFVFGCVVVVTGTLSSLMQIFGSKSS